MPSIPPTRPQSQPPALFALKKRKRYHDNACLLSGADAGTRIGFSHSAGKDCEMVLNVTIEVWKKGSWYVAKAPELDFISQGRTIQEARSNLEELIGIQIQEMREMGTLEGYLTECGFELNDDEASPKSEMVGFERCTLRVA